MSNASQKPTHRSGTAALVGRPNVGKSTLLNAALGQALAIVSPVPQTTRHRLLGVVHRPHSEIVLIDTPGIHKPESQLGRTLNRTARGAVQSADVVVYVTAPGTGKTHGPHPGDRILLADVGSGSPTLLVINQIDKVRDKKELLPVIEQLSALRQFTAIVPVSALRNDGVNLVLDEIEKLLPEGERRFEEDELTDRPVRFFAAEFVREQILLSTREEIPHAVAIEITSFEERDTSAAIQATIHVERDGQKAILVGHRGSKLKAVGIAARLRIEELTGKKVHLALWVQVTPGWTNSEESLTELGYREP